MLRNEKEAVIAEVARLLTDTENLFVSDYRGLKVAELKQLRNKLREKYGADAVPERGPIPAHLLGNMWFLYVFGDAVEDAFGPWWYLGLYLASGFFGTMAFVATAGASPLPVTSK